MAMHLLTEQEVRDSIDMVSAIDAIEAAFAALGRGDATLPPQIGLPLAGGLVLAFDANHGQVAGLLPAIADATLRRAGELGLGRPVEA